MAGDLENESRVEKKPPLEYPNSNMTIPVDEPKVRVRNEGIKKKGFGGKVRITGKSSFEEKINTMKILGKTWFLISNNSYFKFTIFYAYCLFLFGTSYFFFQFILSK